MLLILFAHDFVHLQFILILRGQIVELFLS